MNQLVPLDPTPEMLDKGAMEIAMNAQRCQTAEAAASAVYRAMVCVARGIGAEGRDPQGLGAQPAEPGPKDAPNTKGEGTKEGATPASADSEAERRREIDDLFPLKPVDPAPASAVPADRFVVVKQQATDTGSARPELGYVVLEGAPLFDTQEDASAAITEAGLPLGWVSMRLSQLHPELFAAPSAPVAPGVAQDAARLDTLEAANASEQWIVAKGKGSFTVWLGRGKHATRATLRAAIDAAMSSPVPDKKP